jgi:hypothetical protein
MKFTTVMEIKGAWKDEQRKFMGRGGWGMFEGVMRRDLS